MGRNKVVVVESNFLIFCVDSKCNVVCLGGECVDEVDIVESYEFGFVFVCVEGGSVVRIFGVG